MVGIDAHKTVLVLGNWSVRVRVSGIAFHVRVVEVEVLSNYSAVTVTPDLAYQYGNVHSCFYFTIFATIAPLHIYRQLRQAYGLSRWSALWRLLVLLVAIFFVMLIFLQILLLLGAF